MLVSIIYNNINEEERKKLIKVCIKYGYFGCLRESISKLYPIEKPDEFRKAENYRAQKELDIAKEFLAWRERKDEIHCSLK